VLRLSNIFKAYGPPSRPIPVLADVSFTVGAGEFCAMLGPSGSGKSTLLNIIGLLDRPDQGRVELDGALADFASAAEAARLRNRLIGFVFQSFQLLPRLTAWQNVALPLLYRGIKRGERKPPALAMLDRVGLSDRADHLPTELSGGQRQRVALARALIGEPKLILADEPTGSLDSVTAGEVMALFRALSREHGVSVLMVTHDRDLAAACDRRIEVLDGRILAAGAPA
jgi:putative ABC transport system ATP-binding protein